MRNTTRILTAATLAMMTGSALAQTQTQNAPLSGPRVQDAGKPDAAKPGEAAAQKKIELPFAAYTLALRSLQRGDDETLRLTPEQAQRVRTINQEHQEAMRPYLEEHREEIAELSRVSGERIPGLEGPEREGRQPQRPREDGARPRPGERPDADPARREQVRERMQERREQNRDTMHPEETDRARPSPEERAKAAERLRELLTAAPADKQSKEKLRAVLTKEQQARVEAAIEAQRQRIREGRPAGPGGPEGRGERRPGGPEGERPARRPARD